MTQMPWARMPEAIIEQMIAVLSAAFTTVMRPASTLAGAMAAAPGCFEQSLDFRFVQKILAALVRVGGLPYP